VNARTWHRLGLRFSQLLARHRHGIAFAKRSRPTPTCRWQETRCRAALHTLRRGPRQHQKLLEHLKYARRRRHERWRRPSSTSAEYLSAWFSCWAERCCTRPADIGNESSTRRRESDLRNARASVRAGTPYVLLRDPVMPISAALSSRSAVNSFESRDRCPSVGTLIRCAQCLRQSHCGL